MAVLVSNTEIEIVSVGTVGPAGPTGLSGFATNIIVEALTIPVNKQMIVYELIDISDILTIKGQLVII